MRKVFGTILLIIAFCMFALGGILLYQKFDGYKENEEIYDDVVSIAVNKPNDEGKERVEIPDGEVPVTDTVEDNHGMSANEYHEKEKPVETVEETTINWDKLSDNTVGWIEFGETVNYPIMQGDDNSYYLKHAYNGVSNANGAIFMNANNDSHFRDMNTIIYGHNLRSGKMFGTFKHYLTKDKKKDLHFYIYTPDGKKRTYEIISIAEVKDGGFAYNYSFSKISEYKDYLTQITESSKYDTGYDYNVTKRTVTLSTCRSVGSAEGWRVIIVGQEVESRQIQEAAKWYKKPTDEKITILDVEENAKKTTEIINELKEQRKAEEIMNTINSDNVD